MFEPQTRQSKAPLPPSASKQKCFSSLSTAPYPINSPYPTKIKATLVAEPSTPGPISQTAFSVDGKLLATTSFHSGCAVFKMPLTGDIVTHLSGHQSKHITSTSWMCDSKHLVTSSDDGCLRFWTLSLSEPLLIVDRLGNSEKPGLPLGKDLRHAQFYYRDQFTLVSCGNAIYLYATYLDPSKVDDIKRYESKNRYSCATNVNMEDCHSITAMSAANQFYSNLTLIATSARDLRVFDWNTRAVVRAYQTGGKEGHSLRPPVHCIALNLGSASCSQPKDAYNLLATSCLNDGISLWDIRYDRSIRRYDSHMNRALPCDIAFSPCGRFLAAGSEDKAAYLYDLRSTSAIHKYTGFSDVVSRVVFHPVKPELLFGTNDGRLYLFAPSSKSLPKKGGKTEVLPRRSSAGRVEASKHGGLSVSQSRVCKEPEVIGASVQKQVFRQEKEATHSTAPVTNYPISSSHSCDEAHLIRQKILQPDET